MTKSRNVYLVLDRKAIEASKNIPNIGNRAAVVHTLISSYNLLSKCELCSGEEATDDNLVSFHSTDYIECLKRAQTSTDLEKLTDSDEISDFNLGYDCPLFENIYNFVKVIAGSSLAAAKKLTGGRKPISGPNACEKQSCDIVTEPKSYLKFKCKELLKKQKKDDEFELPGNLTLDEQDIEETDMDKSNSKIQINSKNRKEAKQLCSENEEIKVSTGNSCPVAINWFGGWHHAQRDEAEGFCYVNDIAITIQYLLGFFKKLLYIDLDIHHGNGVENAFSFSSRVLTLSIHKYEPGFYPASGSLNEVGQGNGKYYSVNVPLKDGIKNDSYVHLFEQIASKACNKFQPECIVMQCGADCVAGDPMGGFNITPQALGKCLKIVLDQNIPLLVLGGGGYNVANSARCWTYLTSLIVDSPVSNDIPDNAYFHLFGPDFELEVKPTLRRDENSEEYLQNVLETVLGNLDKLPT